MDEELREILSKWVEQTRCAGEAQVEATRLVCKLYQRLAVKDIIEKIKETESGSHLSLN